MPAVSELMMTASKAKQTMRLAGVHSAVIRRALPDMSQPDSGLVKVSEVERVIELNEKAKRRPRATPSFASRRREWCEVDPAGNEATQWADGTHPLSWLQQLVEADAQALGIRVDHEPHFGAWLPRLADAGKWADEAHPLHWLHESIQGRTEVPAAS